MVKTRVWYHGGCYDGFGAAWVMRKWLLRTYNEDDLVFVPCTYGMELPEVNEGDNVYIVDFSFPREKLQQVAAIPGCTLIVLDHHKTAEADLKGLPYCTFDMNRSGCGMAWDFCFPEKAGNRPIMIDAIEDRDLWRFKKPYTKEIQEYIRAYHFDFKTWDILVEEIEYRTDSVVSKGRLLLQQSASLVENILKKSWLINLDGHTVAVCNASSHFSEIGESLCFKYPEAAFGMSCGFVDSNTCVFSLRSRSDFDVSAVAKKYGGGGHKNAAGFKANALMAFTILFNTKDENG